MSNLTETNRNSRAGATAPRRVLWTLMALAASLAIVPVAQAVPNAITETAGTTWTSRTAASSDSWRSIAYGNGRFVAVSNTGTGTRVMSSTDGVTWSTTSTGVPDGNFSDVTWDGTNFIAVTNNSQTSTTNRAITSSDGINWTGRSFPVARNMQAVTCSNSICVAVGNNGGAGTAGRAMSSADNGATWTARFPAADNSWFGVAYGNGTFVAVSNTNTANGGSINDRVMTSTNGTSWTARTAAANNNWTDIAYGNGTFVAVAASGVNRVMTSTDGASWSPQTVATNDWQSITYGNGLFVAVSTTGTGNRVMTSPDGVTWTQRTSASDTNWLGVAAGNGVFAAVAGDGSAMTSNPSSTAATLDTGTSSLDKGALVKGSGWTTGAGAPSSTAFNWQYCTSVDNNASCTDIAGANAAGAWYNAADASVGYQIRLKTAMTTVYGIVNSFSALSGIVKPVGTAVPTLSSQSPKVGRNIASSFGTWKGWITGTSTVSYEWRACTSQVDGGSCSAIPGSTTGPNYVPSAGQVGKYLRVFVTITTRGQSASQLSAITTNPVVS
ncbi:MAG: hypothetical protein WCL20_04745 [Actinomycetes bacterium]